MNGVVIAGLLTAIGVVCPANTALSDTGSLAGRLQLTVDLDTCVWAPGSEPPRALVTYTNLSSEELTFDRPTTGPRAHMQYDYSQWLVVSDSQGVPVAPAVGVYVELPAGVEWVPDVTVGPGETYWYYMELSWWGYDVETWNPGSYEVRAVYEYFDVPFLSFDDPDEEEQWMDQNHQLLLSNVVQLEILEQGAKAPEAIKLARDGAALDRSLPRMLVKGNLMADARAFTEAGASVTQESGRATIARGDNTVTLPVGRWPREMQDKHVPAIPSMGGGLLVPVRYVAESLGMRVHWDAKTKTANILTG
ncbi:MAG: copper amine oxidase N-terminal domain-containing protein [Armatimonadota bacterium]|nr:MAG: copper amine oxidase N-terminal domain-containing protein [Armatimonadota bacterium]